MMNKNEVNIVDHILETLSRLGDNKKRELDNEVEKHLVWVRMQFQSRGKDITEKGNASELLAAMPKSRQKFNTYDQNVMQKVLKQEDKENVIGSSNRRASAETADDYNQKLKKRESSSLALSNITSGVGDNSSTRKRKSDEGVSELRRLSDQSDAGKKMRVATEAEPPKLMAADDFIDECMALKVKDIRKELSNRNVHIGKLYLKSDLVNLLAQDKADEINEKIKADWALEQETHIANAQEEEAKAADEAISPAKEIKSEGESSSSQRIEVDEIANTPDHELQTGVTKCKDEIEGDQLLEEVTSRSPAAMPSPQKASVEIAACPVNSTVASPAASYSSPMKTNARAEPPRDSETNVHVTPAKSQAVRAAGAAAAAAAAVKASDTDASNAMPKTSSASSKSTLALSSAAQVVSSTPESAPATPPSADPSPAAKQGSAKSTFSNARSASVSSARHSHEGEEDEDEEDSSVKPKEASGVAFGAQKKLNRPEDKMTTPQSGRPPLVPVNAKVASPVPYNAGDFEGDPKTPDSRRRSSHNSEPSGRDGEEAKRRKISDEHEQAQDHNEDMPPLPPRPPSLLKHSGSARSLKSARPASQSISSHGNRSRRQSEEPEEADLEPLTPGLPRKALRQSESADILPHSNAKQQIPGSLQKSTVDSATRSLSRSLSRSSYASSTAATTNSPVPGRSSVASTNGESGGGVSEEGRKQQQLREEMENRIRRMSSTAPSTQQELMLQEAEQMRELARKRAMDRLRAAPKPETSGQAPVVASSSAASSRHARSEEANSATSIGKQSPGKNAATSSTVSTAASSTLTKSESSVAATAGKQQNSEDMMSVSNFENASSKSSLISKFEGEDQDQDQTEETQPKLNPPSNILRGPSSFLKKVLPDKMSTKSNTMRVKGMVPALKKAQMAKEKMERQERERQEKLRLMQEKRERARQLQQKELQQQQLQLQQQQEQQQQHSTSSHSLSQSSSQTGQISNQNQIGTSSASATPNVTTPVAASSSSSSAFRFFKKAQPTSTTPPSSSSSQADSTMPTSKSYKAEPAYANTVSSSSIYAGAGTSASSYPSKAGESNKVDTTAVTSSSSSSSTMPPPPPLPSKSQTYKATATTLAELAPSVKRVGSSSPEHGHKPKFANDEIEQEDMDTWKEENNYALTDRSDSEYESSESESERSKKPVPEWAQKANLQRALHRQYFDERRDPDLIFGKIPVCDLEAIFNNSKKRYKSRGSSGIWLKDGLTLKETKQYRKDLGLQ